jgi:hypothetical protein
MTLRFRGLFEPHEVATGDRRMFKANGLTNRNLPLPLMMRSSSGGHMGAEVVGKITKIESVKGGRSYSGDFLDPKVIPAVRKAIYLARHKMVGPSVDLDRSFTVEPRPHTDGKPMAYFTSGNVIGVTLVPMPAFADVTFEVEGDDEEDKALVASILAEEFAVSGANWSALPVAPRDYTYDADDAVKRIAQWAGVGTAQANTSKYASMFLWRGGNQTGDTLAQEDFRLPIGDIINGQPYLVFHAIYAAAALLSGAHGGLPNIPEGEKTALKGVINQIYPKMAHAFGDETMHSPFTGDQQGGQQQMSQPVEEFAAKAEPYGDVEYADPGYRDNKKRYPINDEQHVRAAWAYINVASNADEYTPEQLKAIRGKIMAAAKRLGIQVNDTSGNMSSLTVDPLQTEFAVKSVSGRVQNPRPAAYMFANPNLKRATKLTVDDDGHVFGHLGKWGECHVGIGDKCVLLPRSRTGYQLFKSGHVITHDGQTIEVGKISLGTGHAHPTYGIVPARDHYDNSGWCAAVVNIGEDQFGIWVSGTLTDPSKADELRRSPLSGDWRRYNGNLELVAALAVNNPGFPVFHQQESEEFSLVAAGMVVEEPPDDDLTFVIQNMGSEVRQGAPMDPSQLYGIVDMDAIEAEVRERLEREQTRKQRLAEVRRMGDFAAQRERARRLHDLLGLTAAAPPAPAPGPPQAGSSPGAPATQATATAGQPAGDPEADPSTPGIAEVDDPGRETMLARQNSGDFYIVQEAPEDNPDATAPDTGAQPAQAAPAPTAAPQPAPPAQPMAQ